MPRISPQILESVFYLYPTKEAAEAGRGVGGTGFVIGITSKHVDNLVMPFIVSNKHVTSDNSFARFNKRDGGIEIFDVFDWHITAQHDLAIAFLPLDLKVLAANMIPDAIFVKEQTASDDIVPGDDVFMVGRFIHVDGNQSNAPSVRFGNVSMLETNIEHQQYGHQKSIVVELRSMCGYSGSPCFLIPSAYDIGTGTFTHRSGTIFLLGVHWGHVTEHMPVQEKIVTSGSNALREGEMVVRYVNTNTGMNGVIAAWHILNMVEHFRPMIDRFEEELIRYRGVQTSGTASDAS